MISEQGPWKSQMSVKKVDTYWWQTEWRFQCDILEAQDHPPLFLYTALYRALCGISWVSIWHILYHLMCKISSNICKKLCQLLYSQKWNKSEFNRLCIYILHLHLQQKQKDTLTLEKWKNIRYHGLSWVSISVTQSYTGMGKYCPRKKFYF